jgi:hypothetical protein
MQEISDGNVHGGDCRILGVSSSCVFLETLHSRLRSFFFLKYFLKITFHSVLTTGKLLFWKVMRRWWWGDQQRNPWTNLIEIFILADACCSWGSGKGVLDQVAHARVNRGNHIFPYWVNSMKPFSHQLLSPKIYLFVFHILLESKYLEFGFMATSL